jgi:CBS domain-containing protein
MSIGKICQRGVDLADPYESVVDAARRMRTKGVGTLVVLDSERRPIGILTDRDIALRVVAANVSLASTRVDQVMTAHPRAVSDDSTIEDSLAVMRSLGVRRLPVVDREGRLVGIASLDDVLSLLAEEMRTVHDMLQKEMPSGALF